MAGHDEEWINIDHESEVIFDYELASRLGGNKFTNSNFFLQNIRSIDKNFDCFLSNMGNLQIDIDVVGCTE